MMRPKRLRLAPTLLFLCTACAPADDQDEMAADTAAEQGMEGAEAATGLALADLAGTWDVRAISEAGDTVPYQLVATDSRQGWEMRAEGRDPIPLQVVAVEGDSVVTRTAPYASMLREDVMVTVTSVMRLSGSRLAGTWVARYETTGADSVLTGRAEGTRGGM